MRGWRARRRKQPLSERASLTRQARELARQGDVDGAVALLTSSPLGSEKAVVLLLREAGRLDDAIAILRASSDPDAPGQLRQFVGERGGELAGLIRVYGVDGMPAGGLGGIDDLLHRGELDEAIRWLRGSSYPADEQRLRNLLSELGRTDELRLLAADSIRGATRRVNSEPVATHGLLARKVEDAVRALLPAPVGDAELATTARLGDEGATYYADVLVSVPELGHVRIAVACWIVNTDAARYFGDNPPIEAEALLAPAGTAVSDPEVTAGVLDELAIRLNAIDPPVPHPGGQHQSITVPLRTAPLTAVPDQPGSG
ncbi:hypothetical protein [Kribbella sp. NPDC051770]|uniref:hypothetical protein n=1 Tax=Kribbella sp. NPDC051770 TaxID=3155413 RepID=UPI003433734D